MEEHLHMSALTGIPLKGPQSFVPMLHAKAKGCIDNNSDDFRITGKEKNRRLIRIKENIFINHLIQRRQMLNWFHLNNDVMVYCVNKSNLAVIFLCV